MNGIEGFLRQHSVGFDAGARTGDADGTHADSNMAADFGDQLADVSKQESKTSDPAGPASLLTRSMPALVQRSLLLETKAEDAAGHGGGRVAPEAGAKIASPLLRGMTPAPDPVDSGASPGVRTLAARPMALGVDAPLGDGKPNGRRPALDTARDSLPGSHSVSDGTKALWASPLAQRPLSLRGLLAAAQAEVTGRSATANAAFAGAAQDGITPLAASRRSAHASNTVERTPPEPTPALRRNSAEPLASIEMGALLGELLSGSIAAAASMPVSALAPAAAYDLAASARRVPQAEGGSLDRTASQGRLEPHASLTANPNPERGPDPVSSARFKVAVVNQQTHFALAEGLSPAQLIAAPVPVSAPVLAPAAAYELAASVGRVPQAEGGGLDRTASQGRLEPHASLTANPNPEHGPDPASSARFKAVAVSQQTHAALANGVSPAQQIAGLVVASARSDNVDANETNAQPGRAFDTARAAVPHVSMSSVQTLQLQLDPENLGRVTVRMRLTGTRLDLRVEAERPETMLLIGKDKVLLTTRLQSAGYAIDTLIIQKADPQAPHPRLGVNVPPSGQEQSTGQANGGPTAHDRPSTHGDRHPSRPAPADDAQDGAAIRPAGSDLYI